VNELDAVNQVVNNNLAVGLYDVVMDTGPGYNSRRQAAVDAMTPILAADPNLMSQIGDLWFRNQDFPGADIIADRLATLNPLAQLDEKSDIPPQAQMALKQLQAQNEELQKALEQFQVERKQRMDIESVKQEAETKRELLRQTGKAYNVETMAEVRVNDQNTRSITSQNKMEIDAIVQLLLKNMDTSRLNAEIDRRNAEQQRAMETAVVDIDSTQNPLMPQ